MSVAVPTTAEADDLDYEGVRLGFWGGQNVDFKGRSFTYSGYPIRATANNMMYTFPDMRVFSGTSQNYWPTFYCSGNNPNVTFKGMMTVLCRATDSYPLSISPVNTDNNSYGVFNVEMKVVGDSGSLFRLCDYKDRAAVGAATNVVKFTGDMSAYAGTIDVKKNVRMTLGGNATEMPGTVLIEDASSRLSLDGISATVGTLRTADAALIEVPEGKTLTVSDAIDLADGTSLAMTAGEPALDLSSCGSLSFGGRVNVQVAMDSSAKGTPVVLVEDMSAAETVMAALKATRNGRTRTPLDLKASVTARGVLVSAVKIDGTVILFK